MGFECSFNKICPASNINVQSENEVDKIKIENLDEDENNENNENNDNNENNNNKDLENVFSLEGIVSISSKKINPLKNILSQKENNLSPAQLNLITNDNKLKSGGDILKKTKTSVFSEYMSDFSFNKFGTDDKNNIFETNYISMKDNYNEETMDYLNKIRNEPKSIIEDIDNILKDENINQFQKFQIENEDTHENIIFEDEGIALKETKNFLYNIEPVEAKFNLNDDLIIDNSELDKNGEANLIKKITKILIDKRKSIIDKYPNCQFFVNFIKDIKINILYLLSEKEEKSNFRNILFNDKFTEFNITWTKEKKNNFISFLCFA